VIFRAIKNIISLLPHITQQGAINEEKKKEKPRLMDVMEARFLSEEAHKRNVELSSLIRNNGNILGEDRLREGVEKKVTALMAPYYQHSEIVDEVTEKLVDVAQHDPYYKRWFG
jgi:hypothetical protein